MTELNALLDTDNGAEPHTATSSAVSRSTTAWYRREWVGFPIWLWALGVGILYLSTVWLFSGEDNPTLQGAGNIVQEEPLQDTPVTPVPDEARLTPPPAFLETESTQTAPLVDVQAYMETNREAITRVSGRADKLSQHLATLSARLDALESRQNLPAPTVAVVTPVTPPPTLEKKAASPAHAIQLVSIATGMTWVKWQDKTWAVQPGDRVNGVTVTRIDIPDRAVHTTAGIIR